MIKVNGSGRFYGQMDNATRFIVDVDEMSAVMDDGSAVSSLVIVNLVGRRGRKLYTIFPLSSSSYYKAVGRARERGVDVVKVVIEDFHNETDVIDLRRFGNGVYSIYSLEGVSYSVPPVVLWLSQWPVRMTVELRSVSSMSSLSGQNFLLSSDSSEGSSEDGGYDFSGIFDSSLVIALIVLLVLVLVVASGYYMMSSNEDYEKKDKMNDVSKNSIEVSEISNQGNELSSLAINNAKSNNMGHQRRNNDSVVGVFDEENCFNEVIKPSQQEISRSHDSYFPSSRPNSSNLLSNISDLSPTNLSLRSYGFEAAKSSSSSSSSNYDSDDHTGESENVSFASLSVVDYDGEESFRTII